MFHLFSRFKILIQISIVTLTSQLFESLLVLTKVLVMLIAVDETQRERTSRAHEQVHPLKNFCQLKKPNVGYFLF